MTRRTELTLMWALVGATVTNLVFVPFAQAGAQLGPNTIGFVGQEGSTDAVPLFLLALTATSLGALAVLRDTATRAGLALLTFGLFVPLSATASFVADWAFVRLEFPQWLALALLPIAGLGWAVGGTAAAVFLLRFPTGEYRSPRWRWVARVGLLGLGLLVAQIFNDRFYSADLAGYDFFYAPSVDSNPLGVGIIPRDIFDLAFAAGVLLLWVAIAGAFGALLVRFFTAHGDERQQLKVVGFTVIAVAVLSLVAAYLHNRDIAPWLFENAAPYLFVLVPVAIGVALFKYRLYDIDVVINKALVYGALVVLITVVFAVIVFLPFAVTGASDTSSTGELVLPLVATVILVVVFQPVRDRLQKWANLIVYGRRATPYEALSDFSKEVARSVADEQLLARMAQILAEGTGAERAEVWLAEGDDLRLAVAHPTTDQPAYDTATDGPPHADAIAEVTHRGELLGMLRLTKKPGDPLRPIERRLLDDLASQAGVVLRNFRLTDELLERLDELRASRQRLVAAQDSERRRLERNLHDGAQQQLVALKIKMGLALQLDDADRRAHVLKTLMADTDDAIESLRTLARGIYPPTLAQEGLVKALRGQAAKAPVPTEVAALGVERYSPEMETAVYYCTLEALQNIAKYANASEARVVLTGTNGSLEFEISDNGTGFDPATTPRGAGLQNMEDRLEALGGHITIVSAPGTGTTVSGTIPVGAAP